MAVGESFEDVIWNLCLRKGCLRLDTLTEEGAGREVFQTEGMAEHSLGGRTGGL